MARVGLGIVLYGQMLVLTYGEREKDWLGFFTEAFFHVPDPRKAKRNVEVAS